MKQQETVYKNIERFNPSTCISGKIGWCSRKIKEVFRKRISKFGLTSSQLSVLFVTAKKGEVSQAELGRILYLEKSTVSRNIKRLYDKEYLDKTKMPKLALTKPGKDFLEHVIPHWEVAMAEIREVLGAEGEESLNIVASQLKNN